MKSNIAKLDDNPLVSICIPVFNKIQYLSIAIDSVLNQSYKNIEVVIVDNCSTDGSFELASAYQSNRVKVYRNNSNIGMIGNWNAAIEKSNGQYIKVICADDLIYPNTVELQLKKLLELGDGVSLISGNRIIINEVGDPVGNFKYPYSGLLDGNFISRKTFLKGKNIIGEPMSCLFRKSDLICVGGFEAPNTYVVDICAWIRLIENKKLYIFNEIVGQFRVSKGASTTEDGFAQIKKFFEYVQLSKKKYQFNLLFLVVSFINISKNSLLRNLFIKFALR